MANDVSCASAASSIQKSLDEPMIPVKECVSLEAIASRRAFCVAFLCGEASSARPRVQGGLCAGIVHAISLVEGFVILVEELRVKRIIHCSRTRIASRRRQFDRLLHDV